jgi:hypothetical protein
VEAVSGALAAEHLASEDGLKVAAETLRRWMLAEGLCTTWAQLGEQETIWAVADALRAWIERYGVPLALYVDGKNLYQRRPRRANGCAGKSQSRSSGACARSWGSS